MRVILIDPASHVAEETQIEPTFNAIKALISPVMGSIQKVVIPTIPGPVDQEIALYVDEDGVAREGTSFFKIPGPLPNIVLAGRAVLVVTELYMSDDGPDERYHSCNYPVEFVQKECTWLNRQFLRFEMREYTTQHAIFGEINVLEQKSIYKDLDTGEEVSG